MNPRQRSDEKARQILEAARTCLTQRGYASTTVSQVAAEAGVSRGLLHYYFESKEDMLVQVVHHSLDPTLQLLGPLLTSSSSAAEMASGLSAATRALILSDPAIFTLVFEAWVVARQSEPIADELRQLFERFRGAMETGLAGVQARGLISTDQTPAQLAMLITGLLDGLALQLVLDPGLAAEESTWSGLEAALIALLGGAVEG
jgi:AcrR family transcriptional regulator